MLPGKAVAAGMGVGGKIFDQAARIGRLGRTPVAGPTMTGTPNVTTRSGRVLDAQAQAKSGYLRAGAVAGGLLGIRSARSSSGSEGLQPHSMGGTTMGPPM